MRLPGGKKSHQAVTASPSSLSPLECSWHLTQQAQGGLRSGKHKPETSQSLEGQSSQRRGLVAFRAKGIKVP